mmetsp:Transcript_37741/g.99863  ORF Transcript_37741/g.99863 Transcript_37741/m.99863 type:complete len:224 (-) Transcript_37741:208-879(-)
MALTSRCLPMRTSARPKRPLHSSWDACWISATAALGRLWSEGSRLRASKGSCPTYMWHISTKARKSVTSCACSPLTSCWQAILSEPRRLSRGWQSVSAVKLLMIKDCSVLAISSRTSSSPLFFDSCSRLHSPWSAISSVTTDAAAVRKSDFMAVLAVRLRNAMKSLFRSRGRTAWSRRSESRTACTQGTSTLVGGHRASTSFESRSQSAAMRALTKSCSTPSS